MNTKKVLVVIVFTILLSKQSFASKTEGFYFGSEYHGRFFNSVGLFKVKNIENNSRKRVIINKVYISNKIQDQKFSEYKGDYNPPFAGGIVFGYKGEFNNNTYN